VEIRPQVLFDRPPATRPRVSLVLTDWSCRESFHILDYLAAQDVPRDWFEVLWIEYYDRAAPEIGRRITEARRTRSAPPIDRWIVMNMPPQAHYHKHLLYNVGVLASRGDLLMTGGSDAMLTPRFVRTLLEAFEEDPKIVLHFEEVRSPSHRFYPFNGPTFDEVLANGTTQRNYRACMCARRDDVIAIGGADEHGEYLGYVGGPYDLSGRLVNLGRREVWHPTEATYHAWHPGADGEDDYLAPHDGRYVSPVALQARRTRRVTPLVENPMIRYIRTRQTPPARMLEDVIRKAVGKRPLARRELNDVKRAVSAGRAAWSGRRYADAIATWEPLRASVGSDSWFLNDLGWSYYFVGRYEDARGALEEAVRLDPRNPDATRGLAWTHLKLNELDAAAAEFVSSLKLIASSEPSAWGDAERGLGWTRLRLGDRARALVHFSRALRAFNGHRGPEYDDATEGFEQASLEPVRRVSAKDRDKASAESDPARIRVRRQLRRDLANAFYNAHQYERALAGFNEALALDANDADAACGAGWAALQLGRLKEARGAFDHVTETSGVEARIVRNAHRGRAWIAYREGRLGHAVKEFKRALKGAHPDREAAAIRDIQRGLRRASYLAGDATVTIRDMAKQEEASRVELAVRLTTRRIRNRLRTVLQTARDRRH